MFNRKKIRELQRENNMLKWENGQLQRRCEEQKQQLDKLTQALEIRWTEEDKEAYIRKVVRETCKG